MSCIPINDFSLITLCDATKAGKLYSIVPDSGAGDFTFERDSTADYTDSSGNVQTAAVDEPRIDFSNTGEYKGLLMQKADGARAKDVAYITSASALISQGSGTILFRPLFNTPTQINVMGIIATVTNEQMKLTYSASKIELFANDTSVGVLNGTFDFTGLDKIELGNYEDNSQLDAHIQNFATI